MTNAAAVADEVESELAPLHTGRLQRLVGPQRPRERRERASPRRARDRALRLPRRRRPLRRDRIGARSRGRRRPGAGSTSSSTPSCRSRRRPSCASGSSSSRRPSRRASRSTAARSTGAQGRRQRDPQDPARQRRRRGAARGVAGVEDGRRARRRRRARARTAPQRGGALARLPRLVRALGHDGRDGRAEAHRHARRGGPGDRRAVRPLEGGSRRAARRPLRLRCLRARPRGTTPTPSSRRSRPKAASTSTRYLEDADLVELSRRTYDGIGLETRDVLARSDLFPRDGKCQHAFCIDIDRAGDVRVLANVVPNQYWMDTMLHELGHATFDTGLDPSLPWLLRDTHLVVTEGIAILMGRLAGDARVARACARRRLRRRSPRSRTASGEREPPSCSSSPAGCS